MVMKGNIYPKDNRRRTPAYFAAKYGHYDICQLIIDNVDDKNPKDKYHNTPLHKAAENGNFEQSHCCMGLKNGFKLQKVFKL